MDSWVIQDVMASKGSARSVTAPIVLFLCLGQPQQLAHGTSF